MRHTFSGRTSIVLNSTEHWVDAKLCENCPITTVLSLGGYDFIPSVRVNAAELMALVSLFDDTEDVWRPEDFSLFHVAV